MWRANLSVGGDGRRACFLGSGSVECRLLEISLQSEFGLTAITSLFKRMDGWF